MMASTIHAKMNRKKLNKLCVIKIGDKEILNPSGCMALRLSGDLMGGAVIFYGRKGKLLFEDVTRPLVEINEEWKVKVAPDPTVLLPKGKSHPKHEAVTLPEIDDSDNGDIEQSLQFFNVNGTFCFERSVYIALEEYINGNEEDDASTHYHQVSADAANITRVDRFSSYQNDANVYNWLESVMQQVIVAKPRSPKVEMEMPDSGTVLGVYKDNRFKSESKQSSLRYVDILGLGSRPELEKKMTYAEDVCSGMIFGRELVNAPAYVLTPALLRHHLPGHGTVITVSDFGAEKSEGIIVASDSLVTYDDTNKTQRKDQQKVYHCGYQLIAGAGNSDVIDSVIKDKLRNYRNRSVEAMAERLVEVYDNEIRRFGRIYQKSKVRNLGDNAPKCCQFLVCGYNNNLPEVRLVCWEGGQAVQRLTDSTTSIGCGAVHALRVLKRQEKCQYAIKNSAQAIIEAMVSNEYCGGHIDSFILRPTSKPGDTLEGGVGIISEKRTDKYRKVALEKKKKQQQEQEKEKEKEEEVSKGESIKRKNKRKNSKKEEERNKKKN